MSMNRRLDRRHFLRNAATAGAGMGILRFAADGAAAGPAPARAVFAQAPLPYPDHALEPYISARTLGFHYGKHHKAYVDKANDLIKGTPMEAMPPVDIIRATAGKPEQAAVFNNAAQAWNHAFFWTCMKPAGGGDPRGALAEKIAAAFGSLDAFRKEFADAALTQFGSGWAWLVEDAGKLKVAKTSNADTPLARGQKCLLTLDVWEHAYYLDYQNKRKDFIDAFLAHLVNWDLVAAQL